MNAGKTRIRNAKECASNDLRFPSFRLFHPPHPHPVCCLLRVALDSKGRNISLDRLIRNAVKVKEGGLVIDVAKESSIRLVDDAVDVGATRSDVLEAGGLDGAVLDKYGVGEDVQEGSGDTDGLHSADRVAAADIVGELDGEPRSWRCGARVGQGRAGEGEGGCDD
jgi:hypothetical protein